MCCWDFIRVVKINTFNSIRMNVIVKYWFKSFKHLILSDLYQLSVFSHQRRYLMKLKQTVNFPCIVLTYIDRGRSETMGKTRVCPRPEGTPNFDSSIFCALKTICRLKVEWKLAKGRWFFGNSFPLKFYFLKIFKMIEESS